jgi:membrane protease YdiL (CAAX protease family)
MNKITKWIKQHQVAAFYILAFAITWGLGFSYGAVVKRSQHRLSPLVSLASCGPALAGMIIATVINTKPKQGSRKAFWIAFLVALTVSAAIHSAYLLLYGRFNYSPVEIGFRLLIVLPVSLVIGAVYSRIPELKKYLSSLLRFRGVWGWVLLALLFYPATVLLSVPISRILGMQNIMANPPPKEGIAMVGWFSFKFIQNFLFFSATGEETGWRGFALPRLQKRLSPLKAALFTALFWMLWYIIKWQGEGQSILSVQHWIDAILHYGLMSFILVWFYNRSKGSTLVAGVNHASAITTSLFFTFRPQTGIYLVWALIISIIIFTDRMWEKLPYDHPAVYHPA